MISSLLRIILTLIIVVSSTCLIASGAPLKDETNKSKEKMPISHQRIKKEPFGMLPGGEQIDSYLIANKHGTSARIITYGGIITELKVKDSSGKLDNVVLGFDSLEPYLADSPYFGSLIGRVANRIAGGKFSLNGINYSLSKNNGPNTLHGGKIGFDKKNWHAEPLEEPTSSGVVLTLSSPDRDENFPGNLQVKVTYRLTDDNELRIDYEAQTDKATPVNLTNHSYFNLAGEGNRDILDHELRLHASAYTPVDETLIPTGKIEKVEGGPFDFTKSKKIGADIDKVPGGYDHNFVLDGKIGELKIAAELKDPASGRSMTMYTTEPGVQFYSGNFLDGSIKSRGKAYNKYFGLCLEAQHFPDAVNKPNFPSIILNPGQTYKRTTVYKFNH